MDVPFSKHPTALVETASVGDGARVGAFVHVLPGATIGRDCEIGDHAFIGNGVILADGVTIRCGVQLGDSIEPPATSTTVGQGATIGGNATVLAGVRIAEHAVVAPGTVVTHDVPRDAIVTGNPARIVGYAGAESAASPGAPPMVAGPESTRIEGVILQRLPRVVDLRSMLTFGEAGREVPFEVKRARK